MKISKKAPITAYAVLSVLLVIAIIIGVNILSNQREILENNGKDNSEAVSENEQNDDAEKGEDKDSDKSDDKNDGKKLPLKDLTGTILKLDDGIESLEITSSANLTIDGLNYPACVQSEGKDGVSYSFDKESKKGTLDITAAGNVSVHLPDELKELIVVKKSGELNIGEVEAKRLSVVSETGDAELNGCKAEYLEAEVNTGTMNCFLSDETKKAKLMSVASHLHVYLDDEAEGFTLTNPGGSSGITEDTGFSAEAKDYGTCYGEEGGTVIEAETSAGGIYIHKAPAEEE